MIYWQNANEIEHWDATALTVPTKGKPDRHTAIVHAAGLLHRHAGVRRVDVLDNDGRVLTVAQDDWVPGEDNDGK